MKPPEEVFSQYLKDKGIRNSEQRNHILDIFLKTEEHLTIAELYGIVVKKYPKIGYATVYRAMKVICGSGLGEEVELGDGVTRYEHKYGHERHDHLVCLGCGKIVEAVNPKMEALQDRVAKGHGFTPVRRKTQIFGICKGCKARPKSKKK